MRDVNDPSLLLIDVKSLYSLTHNFFSVISVFAVDTSRDMDLVTFGTDYSMVRMRKDQFLDIVPRNNQKMVLLELSKGMLAFNKNIILKYSDDLRYLERHYSLKLRFVLLKATVSVDSIFSVNVHNQFTSGEAIGDGDVNIVV